MRTFVSMILSLAILWTAGCGDSSSGDASAAAGDVQVRMDFSRTDGLYAAPFPSADLLRSDGRVDVSLFPNPDNVRIVDQVVALIGRDADGFALSGGIFFSLTGAVDRSRLPDVNGSLTPQARVFLMSVDDRKRTPVQVEFVTDGGPFGAPNLLSLLPYQGLPLKPKTHYAAVVCAELLDTSGRQLRVSPAVEKLAASQAPDGLSTAQAAEYLAGYRAAAAQCRVAALAVFTTGSPADDLYKFTRAALQLPAPTPGPFVAGEIFDDYCVYSSTIDLPDYQQGVAPYGRSGGDWRVDAQGQPLAPHFETASLFVTIPRQPMPANGYPLAMMVRTGGGGDRPLVDRGVHAVNGGPPIVPGSGPAQEFARVGYAGVQVDGPLGGLRNTTHQDEQFLIFNVFNIASLRDNIRESALELAVFAAALDNLEVDSSGCPGASALAKFDPANRALMGHSTGATIAPLVMAIAPQFRAAVLSGEGGSYLQNVLYKHKPLDVLPVANSLVQYTDRTLTAHDPVLTFVQWATEPADPPIYAELVTRNPRYRGEPAHVLMLQGIVDNYILPNIANSSSLAFGLDLAGPALDDPARPGLAGQAPILSLLPLSGRKQIQYPASCNLSTDSGCVTAVLTQHLGDAVEDGHEVVFQTEPPKHQYRCFLKTLLRGAPTVPADDAGCD